MERTIIKDLKDKIGKEVSLFGRILNIRKLGQITFIVLQDYSGTVQTVWETEVKASVGEAVKIQGTVKADTRSKSGVELGGSHLEIISTNIEELPYDFAGKDLNLQLNTLLDLRTTSLRHPKAQAVFKLYDLLLEGYEKTMRAEGFTEIKTPKIIETASEGGANFFKIKYFDQDAYLAQSPQLYKQIMVGVFERVFEIGSVFRAEPHFTTRHINEFTGLDAEMGFIENFKDVSSMLNKVIKNVFDHIRANGSEYLAAYNAEIPEVPENIPSIKLADLRKLVKEKYDYTIPETTDIDPEGERLACRWAKEEHNSDFVFITNYFWKDKPFYTMPSDETQNETEGFDLLFRGVEIATGSQRIHDYKMLIKNMEAKGVKAAGLESYLDTFKFAMPPHGGWGLGSERIIQLILGLGSIKEAVLFPRDVKRLNP
ncbi:MAG: aspartate--tRNA(Asn) ligase [Candidatus Berkelbacteria bacterium]